MLLVPPLPFTFYIEVLHKIFSFWKDPWRLICFLFCFVFLTVMTDFPWLHIFIFVFNWSVTCLQAFDIPACSILTIKNVKKNFFFTQRFGKLSTAEINRRLLNPPAHFTVPTTLCAFMQQPSIPQSDNQTPDNICTRERQFILKNGRVECLI